MKKLYSFLSVLAVAALGVNAAPTLHKTATFTPKHQLKAAEIEAVATAHKLPEVKNVHRIAAPAEDVCDSYSIEFSSFNSAGNGMANYISTITISEFVDGMLELSGLYDEYPMYGEYDPETGVFAIEPEDIGIFQIADANGNPMDVTAAYAILTLAEDSSFVPLDKATYDITYNGAGFDTPEDCFLGVIAKYPDTGNFIGVFDFFYNLTIERTPWENIGTCTFTDGIISMLYNKENEGIEDVSLWQPLTITDIPLQQLETDPAQIRMQSYFNMFGGEGHLTIDLTDPNRVVVPYQETGVVINTNYGVTSICSISDLVNQDGTPTVLEDGEFITYANGVINFEIHSIGYIFPKTTTEGMNPNSVYSMRFQQPSELILPEDFNAGIGNVNAATTDKVEYFNLQGIRIENPTHGLYIRRAGKKVEKVIL